MASSFVVVFDACVLYPAPVRDLLMHLSVTGLFRARWTDRIHEEWIEAVLRKGGETGKRLDFLIQELHREANTLGSKAATLELTRISVDMKVFIEQMREQVQNIE